MDLSQIAIIDSTMLGGERLVEAEFAHIPVFHIANVLAKEFNCRSRQ